MLDITRLKVFLSVVETGSLGAAAEELDVSPSAVSQQLKKLERDCGVPLLTRGTRGARPTEAGILLAERCRTLFRQLAATEADLAEIREGRAGILRIGTFPTFAASALPGVIRAFQKRFPNVELKIVSGRFNKLLQELEEGAIHLSLLWEYPWNPFKGEDLHLTHLFKEETVLITPTDFPLPASELHDFSALKDQQWILRSDNHPAGEALERLSNRAGFRPKVAMYANDYNETQAMVSVGIGIALAPASAVAIKHPDIKVIRLPSATKRNIFLARRAARSYSTLENAFRSVLIETVSTQV